MCPFGQSIDVMELLQISLSHKKMHIIHFIHCTRCIKTRLFYIQIGRNLMYKFDSSECFEVLQNVRSCTLEKSVRAGLNCCVFTPTENFIYFLTLPYKTTN